MDSNNNTPHKIASSSPVSLSKDDDAGSPTNGGVLFRRRSTLSPSSWKDGNGSKSIHDDDGDLHSVGTVDAEDSDWNGDDVESGGITAQAATNKSLRSNSNNAKNTRLGVFMIWVLVVVGLCVGLVFAFSSNNTSDNTANNTLSAADQGLEGRTETPYDSNSTDTVVIGGGDWLNLTNSTLVGDNDQDNTKQNQSTVGSSSSSSSTELSEWPQLVGTTGEDAKQELESMYGVGTYNIVILHENDPTTRDIRWDRIRIFTDDDGIVVEVPKIG
jgi:hypothetical protein